LSNSSLNPDIFNKAKDYANLKVEFVGGNPRIIFFSEDNIELEEIQLNNFSSDEIEELLKKKRNSQDYLSHTYFFVFGFWKN